jgi:hypothetical protein
MMAWGLLGAGVWFGRETGQVENVIKWGRCWSRLEKRVPPLAEEIEGNLAFSSGTAIKSKISNLSSYGGNLCGLFAVRSPSKAARDPRAFSRIQIFVHIDADAL